MISPVDGEMSTESENPKYVDISVYTLNIKAWQIKVSQIRLRMPLHHITGLSCHGRGDITAK